MLDHPLWALVTNAWADYAIQVADQAGNPINMTERGKEIVQGSNDFRTHTIRKMLSPGQSAKVTANLRNVYNLAAGHYVLTCQRKGVLQAVDIGTEGKVEFVRPKGQTGFPGLTAKTEFDVAPTPQ